MMNTALAQLSKGGVSIISSYSAIHLITMIAPGGFPPGAVCYLVPIVSDI